MIIRFTILGECVSMKNSRQIVHFGKRVAIIKSKEARAYQDSLLLQIPAHAKQMLVGDLKATVRVFYASKRKDVDAELIFDALAAKYERRKGKLEHLCDGKYAYAKGERVLTRKGVYINDRQVRIKLIYGDVIDPANPRAEIEIEPLQAQQADLIEEPHESWVEQPVEEGAPF